MLPNYLVIGAARSGTGWLARNLRLHPEIFMHSKKELHFFDKDYNKGIGWYEQYFNNVNQNSKAIGEGTPAYLYDDNVAGLIKKHLPNVKLIASLRDPVDRAYSHYSYRDRERQSEGVSLTFEQKIEDTPRLIETGLYAKQLEIYYDLFPKENILIVLYDELKKDPKQYLEKVYKFLDVGTEFSSSFIDSEINSSSNKLGKYHSLYLLNKALVKTGFFGAAKLVNKLNKEADTESVSIKAQKVSIETRDMLLEKYYLKDIEKLEKIIQMDLSEWKKIQSS